MPPTKIQWPGHVTQRGTGGKFLFGLKADDTSIRYDTAQSYAETLCTVPKATQPG